MDCRRGRAWDRMWLTSHAAIRITSTASCACLITSQAEITGVVVFIESIVANAFLSGCAERCILTAFRTRFAG